MIRRFWADGYRSLRKFDIDLGDIHVVVGANGSGKSNFYRALNLLAMMFNDRLREHLAAEGGMPSLVWAGKLKKGERVRTTVGAEFADFNVEATLGLPAEGTRTMFQRDPEIKEEIIWPRDATKRSMVFKRTAGLISYRDDDGRVQDQMVNLGSWESAFASYRDPLLFPELFLLRDRLTGMRFYHAFDTRIESPLRQPAVLFRSGILADDGQNLVSVLQMIRETGDTDALDRAVDVIAEGGRLSVESQAGLASLELQLPGMMRPLDGRELSDGQLRFLCLTAVLLSPRPPTVLVLNEPETSLHPSWIPGLATLIQNAAETSQIIVTTHSAALAEALISDNRTVRTQFEKRLGVTVAVAD